jgi:WD40 repeat protein
MVATRLVVSSQIRLWDFDSAKRIRELGRAWPDPAHPLNVGIPPMTAMTIDFAHDGKLVAVSGADDVIVYDTYNGDQKWSAQGQGLAVGHNSWSDAKFSPSGKILAGQNAGSVELFDSETGKPLGAISAGRNLALLSMAWSPDGESLAFQEVGGVIKLASVKTRKVRRTLHAISVPGDHVVNIAFSADGSTLLAADASGQVVFFDPQSGKQQARIKSTGAHVVQIAVSPDGTFATGSDDNVVRIWDIPAAAKKQ